LLMLLITDIATILTSALQASSPSGRGLSEGQV